MHQPTLLILFLLALIHPILAAKLPAKRQPFSLPSFQHFSFGTPFTSNSLLFPRQCPEGVVCCGDYYCPDPGTHCYEGGCRGCPTGKVCCDDATGTFCEPGNRCQKGLLNWTCCPIGEVCGIIATCTDRSDPKCESRKDCCPEDYPICERGSCRNQAGRIYVVVDEDETPTTTTRSTTISFTLSTSTVSTASDVRSTTITTSDTITGVVVPIVPIVTVEPDSTRTTTTSDDQTTTEVSTTTNTQSTTKPATESPVQTEHSGGNAIRSGLTMLVAGLGVVFGAFVMM